MSSPGRDPGARRDGGGDAGTDAGATGATGRVAVAAGMSTVAYAVPNGHVGPIDRMIQIITYECPNQLVIPNLATMGIFCHVCTNEMQWLVAHAMCRTMKF